MRAARSPLLTAAIGALAVAALLIGLNMLADTYLAGAQLDATQGHRFTLARGTRSVLRGLKQPITLRLFYSRVLGSTLPAYGSYAARVREMLEQYARIAHGKVRLEFYNPEPFSDVEDRAVAYGLQGVPLDQGGQQIYFGLAGTNQVDDERTVAFFQPERERFLEYDLTRLVWELSNPKRPVVGLMTSLPVDGDPRMMMMRGSAAGQPWASIAQLRQSNTVRSVPLDTAVIDPDIQVLLVAQAQHLSPATLYAIDQFVMRGGRLMAMVDPDSEIEAQTPTPGGAPPADTASDLKPLFAAWGIDYDPGQVVGDLTGAWRVRAPAAGGQPVPYVAWFSMRDGISHSDPATAELSSITVASAGALAKHPGAAIAFTPLLTSSAQSALLPVAMVKDNPDPARILAQFKPAGGPRVIAARVRGVLNSAFTGPPPPVKGQAPVALPPFRARTQGPANLVVVADTDLLADRFWVQVQDFFGQSQATPFGDNGPFVANLVGTLAGGDALIGLRSRGDAQRPFTRIDAMQSRAEARFRATQQTLRAHLEAVQKQLTSLREGGGRAAAQQRQAIDTARQEIVGTRRQLRAVQLNLNREIDGLEDGLRLFDIVLVPALLIVFAVLLGLLRRRRRRAAVA